MLLRLAAMKAVDERELVALEVMMMLQETTNRPTEGVLERQ